MKKTQKKPLTAAEVADYTDFSPKTPEQWKHTEGEAKAFGSVLDRLRAKHPPKKK